MDRNDAKWDSGKAKRILDECSKFGLDFRISLNAVVRGEIDSIIDDVVRCYKEGIDDTGSEVYMDDVSYYKTLREVVLEDFAIFLEDLAKGE